MLGSLCPAAAPRLPRTAGWDEKEEIECRVGPKRSAPLSPVCSCCPADRPCSCSRAAAQRTGLSSGGGCTPTTLFQTSSCSLFTMPNHSARDAAPTCSRASSRGVRLRRTILAAVQQKRRRWGRGSGHTSSSNELIAAYIICASKIMLCSCCCCGGSDHDVRCHNPSTC